MTYMYCRYLHFPCSTVHVPASAIPYNKHKKIGRRTEYSGYKEAQKGDGEGPTC